MIDAPEAGCFPRFPVSWYLFGRSADIGRQPVARDYLGRRLVAYRTTAGGVVVLDGRCAHLGADLGRGRVVADRLRCPFHHWEYGPDGRCVHIPSGDAPPAAARQQTFPAVERYGFVWFFNGERPLFELPFFPGVTPAELVAARPFSAVLHCPWFLVGANGFDAQHFRAAHDRVLLGDPAVTCPAPFARRATALFAVEGRGVRDAVTRVFAGNRVELSMDDWCGNLLFVTARFRRTRSFGMVACHPLGLDRTHVQVIVFVRRSRWRAGRLLFDPLNAAVRRWFIRQFLKADAEVARAGLRYNPHGLSASDAELAGYFRWLAAVSHGRPQPAPERVAAAVQVAAAAAGKGAS
jgi:nitrite reductase/ring-hydroxylating ferredoxin subunit